MVTRAEVEEHGYVTKSSYDALGYDLISFPEGYSLLRVGEVTCSDDLELEFNDDGSGRLNYRWGHLGDDYIGEKVHPWWTLVIRKCDVYNRNMGSSIPTMTTTMKRSCGHRQLPGETGRCSVCAFVAAFRR